MKYVYGIIQDISDNKSVVFPNENEELIQDESEEKKDIITEDINSDNFEESNDYYSLDELIPNNDNNSPQENDIFIQNQFPRRIPNIFERESTKKVISNISTTLSIKRPSLFKRSNIKRPKIEIKKEKDDYSNYDIVDLSESCSSDSEIM